jgi:hypothetical protein
LDFLYLAGHHPPIDQGKEKGKETARPTLAFVAIEVKNNFFYRSTEGQRTRDEIIGTDQTAETLFPLLLGID